MLDLSVSILAVFPVIMEVVVHFIVACPMLLLNDRQYMQSGTPFFLYLSIFLTSSLFSLIIPFTVLLLPLIIFHVFCSSFLSVILPFLVILASSLTNCHVISLFSLSNFPVLFPLYLLMFSSPSVWIGTWVFCSGGERETGRRSRETRPRRR